jgi:SulP family sulfate permease
MAGNKNLLQNVYLFKGLNPDQLEAISAAGQLETFNAGDDLFAQGDKARALYIIKYGSVRILQKSKSGDNIEVATLGTGSHFGEMAFVDGEPRSASASVVEKSEIAVLNYEKLQNLLKKDLVIAVHFYQELAHFLCGRLRLTTTDLSFAREKNLSHF